MPEYHKSAKVKAFLEIIIRRLTVHYLQPYFPDYYPIEGLWKNLKKQTTPNVYCESLDALKMALKKGLKHLGEVPSEVMALLSFYEHLA